MMLKWCCDDAGWCWDDVGMMFDDVGMMLDDVEWCWMMLGWCWMMLGWSWDDVGWCWDDVKMMLKWCCDDAGWCWDDVGMMFDDVGMMLDDVGWCWMLLGWYWQILDKWSCLKMGKITVFNGKHSHQQILQSLTFSWTDAPRLLIKHGLENPPFCSMSFPVFNLHEIGYILLNPMKLHYVSNPISWSSWNHIEVH